MDIRKIGALRTIGEWEKLMATLPRHAEGEGLGLMWENEVPPSVEGRDPTIRQGWRLSVERGVSFRPPKDAEIVQVPIEASPTGKPYTLVRVSRTAVHLHGVEIRNDVVAGNAHVCLRVIWPKGADVREDDGVAKAWRNYMLYVDIYPTTDPPKSRLKVYREGTERSPLIMLGSQETDEETGLLVTGWATRSANWRAAEHGYRARPSNGIDQLIAFSPIRSSS